ncbi:MAG: YehR family protein [Bacilli bacterium]|nr:YehR family protein [Bacilli bacterium]
MKKMISVLLLCVCIGIVSGCGAKKKTVECTVTQTLSNYKLNATYKIYATGDVVDKVETVEVVESSDTSILKQLETQVTTQYEDNNKKYGGTDYKITNNGSKLESKVTIDYSKFDMEKMVSDNSAMKSLVNKKNRLTVKGATSLYETMGATCK